MYRSIKNFFRRIQSSKNPSYDLDILLAQANPEASIYQRISWFVDLMQWVRYKSYLLDDKEIENVRQPLVRLKFLIRLLNRNLEWKRNVSKTLRSILRETRDVELFASTGLADDQSFWSEFFSRLYTKILPNRPLSEGGAQILKEIFPDKEDLQWVSQMTEEQMQALIDLVHFEKSEDEDFTALFNDIEEALLILGAQLSAIGMSYPVRRRAGRISVIEMPFFDLNLETEILVSNLGQISGKELQESILKYKKLLRRCFDVFNEVYRHLDEHGVSTKVVFLLELSSQKLKRMNDLIDLLSEPNINPKRMIYFLSQLIEENQEQYGILPLIEQNTRLLSRKIVERSAESGEDYIARDEAQYKKLFKKALGGGAFMSITVLIKVLISSLRLADFMQGFFYSLNYASSFVAIQLCGLTVATKQPAMTAPALAEKLQNDQTSESNDALVDEVIKLVRTQFAGVFGNVLTVIPCILLVDLILQISFSVHFVSSEDKAIHLMNTSNLLSMAPIYACFTGVLLWFSSVVAGYADNWFYLNRMGTTIRYNRRINYIFGDSRTEKIASFLEKNISPLAGNISLGFFLGMVPAINYFFGFIIDIRHVTLAAGNFALGSVFFGLDVFKEWDFWLSGIGLFFIGSLNIGVSFALAFWVALKSRRIYGSKQTQVFWTVVRRFKKRPLSFFLPLD